MEESVTMLGDFLGDYFIRKCMWSTPSSVKTTAARLKKFCYEMTIVKWKYHISLIIVFSSFFV